MIFWIIAGLITLLVTAITIYPVFATKQTLDSPLEYDKEIYKARLEEIDEERTTGTINEKEYNYAVAEEGRRFLALVSASSGINSDNSKVRQNSAMLVGALALILIPAIGASGYYLFGSFNMSDQPLQARLDADPKGQSIGELLQRAERQLMKNPDDGRGWLIVAPVYMRLDRATEAATAYRNAIRILGATPELQTSLGEALTVEASGVVSEEAYGLFRQAAASDPENAKPFFFIGIALNQAGEYEKSADLWQKLIGKSSPDAGWLEMAQQQLQLAQSNLGKKPSPDAPGNPSAEDIEAAGQMSTGDRNDFINSMVERLSGELQENPQNKPGWQRIIRSYTVLGRKTEALAAIKEAEQVFKDDAEFIKELAQNKLALN